jgi:hypothetical protein
LKRKGKNPMSTLGEILTNHASNVGEGLSKIVRHEIESSRHPSVAGDHRRLPRRRAPPQGQAVQGRRYTTLCECKYWRSAVPQAVIHGFRTVVGDIGANKGYAIAVAWGLPSPRARNGSKLSDRRRFLAAAEKAAYVRYP